MKDKDSMHQQPPFLRQKDAIFQRVRPALFHSNHAKYLARRILGSE